MAANFTFKLGTLDLSSYLRVNPDDPSPMDPYSTSFVDPAFAETPFSDGQVLISTTVNNREQTWGLFLVDPSRLKDQVHALIQSINVAAAQRPLQIFWQDSGASNGTFYDVAFVRFEPNFNFRRSVHGYAAGVLHTWTSGYGHTGTVRLAATAAGTGIFLSVPIPSVAGDAPALLDVNINAGAVVPSLGRVVAIAPIPGPSYAPQILAAALTDLQTGATLIGASGADASQYLALPVSPTGGASGVACKVPLPNPTIAGGDNRILAVVQSGIDAGVGIYALDPYGNSLGATAVASNSQGWGLVDLGVCRLPTVGYPTQPKISIYAGGVWASGAAGPLVLASPAALRINEVLCLPDKSLTLLYERGSGGSVLSKDGFMRTGQLNGQNDDVGNRWSEGWNNRFPTTLAVNLLAENLGYVNNPGLGGSTVDSSHLTNILTDRMLISGKAVIASSFGLNPSYPGDVRLVKEWASGGYLMGRLSCGPNGAFVDVSSATSTTLNTLASLALATLGRGQKYVLSLRAQGPLAAVNLSRDDGGPVFIPGSAALASIGVASDAGAAIPGMPGIGIGVATGFQPQLYSWEVDSIGSSNLQPYDAYTISGNQADSYRISSAGAFAGQKLVSQQRGAFAKLAPSTTSLAVVCAPVDQGVANDLISAAVSVRERFNYAR